MPEEIKQQCATCIFWKEIPRHRDEHDVAMKLGECKRYPPAIDKAQNRFPCTRGIEWCGEFYSLKED